MTATHQKQAPARATNQLRRYLCALATLCAAASGDPDPTEVLAAVYVLERDVPRALGRLKAAA